MENQTYSVITWGRHRPAFLQGTYFRKLLTMLTRLELISIYTSDVATQDFWSGVASGRIRYRDYKNKVDT